MTNQPPHTTLDGPTVSLWLTGFDAFPGVPSNPTATIVRNLTMASIGTLQLKADVLPVVFEGTAARIAAGYCDHAPRLAVHLGVATRRRTISLERQACNQVSPGCPDAAGLSHPGGPVNRSRPGRRRLRTALPLAALVRRLRSAGFPARVSHDAGAYVCNFVY